MLAELVALVTIGHWQLRAALLRLAPGALMILALRGALVGSRPEWIVAALAAAFPAHLADLAAGAPRRR